ncbi:polyprenol phosphomannose-dependent alpha 1,6 mannosyltransferase MptB [Actinoplanes sp. NEAU-A12]|uniref:Polyprenol phosphomannose-dependent alpha 1,6 mannosyltransferase MptB n=1 Tax=Actinoplanes sandaracinus TaxID=3045177 RepID=A0ABT6WFY8_9ACTN|nr:polyprenol phosphomannose-dependent alpha 1,6 mannosyltransferase MptB [Actinoplanes sandaracinus]MDI6098615.1 polyprenol phosphomannose-dependent alpha 1,6 mannosyltransferase MptB [Actinoplanes sandaracinus]
MLDFRPGTLPATAPPTPSVTAVTVTGCIGSLVMVVVAFCSFLPMPAAVALGVTGMGLLVAAWLRLGRRHRRLPARSLYRIAAVWSLPLLAAPPLFSGDVWSYIAQGVIAATGQDAYELGPLQALGADSAVTGQVSPYWVRTPAPYGPAWMALSRAVATLTGEHLVAGVLLYRLIALVGVGLVAWALPRLARRAGAEPSSALWLGLLNPLVLWHLVAGAHNDGIMLGLMLCGMEIGLRGVDRGRAAGQRLAAGLTLLTVAANIKVVAFAAVCCLIVVSARRRARPAETALGMVLGAGAVTAGISIGTGLGFGWISAISSSTAVHSWLAPTNIVGFLVGAVGDDAGTGLTDSAITASVTAGAAVCAAVLARLLWSMWQGRLDLARGVGLVFAAVVLCGPVVQPWYLLWAVLPLAATARNRRDRKAVAAVSALLAVALPPVGSGATPLVTGYLAAALLLAGILLGLPRIADAAGRRTRSDANGIDRCPSMGCVSSDPVEVWTPFV